MDEFTLSAFALYPDGRSSDAFAEVSGRSLVDCFGAMAGEVADWLPQALARGVGTGPPQSIELTLEWSGAPAPTPAPERPAAPCDSAVREPRPPRRALRCAARHRIGRAVPVALPGHPVAAGLLGADA